MLLVFPTRTVPYVLNKLQTDAIIIPLKRAFASTGISSQTNGPTHIELPSLSSIGSSPCRTWSILFYYQSEDPLNNTVVPQLHIFLFKNGELVIYWPSTFFVNLFTVITILFYREGRLLYPNVFNFYWTQWKLLAFNEMTHWDIPFTYRQSAKGTERKKWTYHLWDNL